jgi:mRNA interferase MazF
MGSQMKFKHRVFLCQFPFDDSSGGKVRPALCLNEPVGPNFHVVVAFISTQIPTNIEAYDMVFDSEQPESQAMGLKLRSVLRLHRLFTTDASLLKRKLGQLPDSLVPQVEHRLRLLLDL